MTRSILVSIVVAVAAFLACRTAGAQSMGALFEGISVNGNGEVVIIHVLDFEPPPGLLGFLVTKKRILEHLDDAFDLFPHQFESFRMRAAYGHAIGDSRLRRSFNNCSGGN